MLRKRFDQSNGGRKPNLKVYPCQLLLGNKNEEIRMLSEIYGMTLDQAKEHRSLYGMGGLYVTHNAKEPCEYTVLVTTGAHVPQQGAFGAKVVQIAIKRMDNKTDPFPWVDIQGIKRALLGDDVEAIELYPKLGRCIRGDNKWRYIWAFPDGEVVPVGWDAEQAKTRRGMDQFDPKSRSS